MSKNKIILSGDIIECERTRIINFFFCLLFSIIDLCNRPRKKKVISLSKFEVSRHIDYENRIKNNPIVLKFLSWLKGITILRILPRQRPKNQYLYGLQRLNVPTSMNLSKSLLLDTLKIYVYNVLPRQVDLFKMVSEKPIYMMTTEP